VRSQVNKKLGYIRERNNVDSYELVPLDFFHMKKGEKI